MSHDLTKAEKKALRAAAKLAHDRDRSMSREDCDVYYLDCGNFDLPLVVGGAVAAGIISIDEIDVVGRERVVQIAEALRAIQDEEPQKFEEEDRHDPTAPVSVAKIFAEIELLREDNTLYVNRSTGEVRVVDHEYLPDEEEEEEAHGDEPEWMRERRAEGGEVTSSPEWVALLDRFDLDEYDVMKRFANRRAGPAASRDLLDALSGRGAFGRFRDVIYRRGLQQEWESYREEQFSEAIRFELEQNEIPYRK